MEFKILGPLLVTDDEQRVDIGGPRQRRLLAALIAHQNQTVTTDALIDIVFDGAPPAGASTTIRTYVARLRKSLGADHSASVATVSHGYALQLDSDEVDADRFASNVALGRRQFDDHAAVDAAVTLRDALALWRGPAYGEFGFEEWARGEAARLDELRVDAEELLIEAQLACGLADDVIPDLRRLIEEHPMRERLRAQLMLAMHRSGRHAEALRAFDGYRSELIEVGLEPTAELIALERSIAAHDPALQLATPSGTALRGYRLGSSLGAGRQGEVFRAVQPVIGREVAIKVIRPDLADDPGFIRRFDHEAQAVSRLEHPHIVPLHDYWREPNAAYMVMRLLPSRLAARVDDGPMDVAEVAVMITQLGSAVAAAHRAGLVHGDIRPSNVLLDDDANFFLSDFGLAGLDPAQPADGNAEPSGFESPEARNRQRPGRATDQFGLALLAAYALTGVLPFGRRGVVSSTDRFPSVHARRPAVPTAADEVLWRAAAWEPDDRYDTVAEFVDEIVGALTGRRTHTETAPINPYKGLEPFHESDARWFFGRDDVVASTLERLRPEAGHQLVTLIGASGSGKSSAVRAGVVPRIRSGALPGSADWFVATMVPGDRPSADLRTALQAIATDARPVPVDASVSSIIAAAVPDGQPLLLVVDQLEELYTLAPDDERAAFIDGLVDALSDDRLDLRVLATLRADFHDRPLQHSRFGRLMAEGAVSVVGMDVGQLDQAIREPAARAGVEIEPAVATEIIADLVDQPAALPLLQFTLTELFDRRSGRVITLESYQAIGGVDAAVASRAEQVIDRLDADDRDQVQRLFLRLVSLDDTGTAMRRRVGRSELAALVGSDERLARLIGPFGEARLLTFDRDPTTREPTVEIAHEALTTQWPRLQSWVLDAGEGLQIRTQLTAATERWIAGGRDAGDLYRGGRLETAETWALAHPESLTDDELAFVHSGVELRRSAEAADRDHAERQARANRRLRFMVAVVGAALVVALIAGYLGIEQRNEAREAARRAATREVIASSSAALAVDPELSALLALEAVGMSDPAVVSEAEQALHAAIARHRLIATVPSNFGHPTFSPDGTRFATSDPIGNHALLWSIDPLAEDVALGGHSDGVTSTTYSPDGRVIATSSLDGVRLWNADTGEQLDELPGIPATRTVFSHDGSLLAVTGFGGEVVWDLDQGTTTAYNRVGGDGGFSVGASFHPDDSLLAVAVNEPSGARVALFDTTTGAVVDSFEGHTDTVLDVEFSLDGSQLYSASEDATVKVWDIDTAVEIGTFTGQGAQVSSLDLSSDGRRMASVGGNGTVLIWNPTTFVIEDRLLGHVETVDTVEFSPDGSMLITQSAEDRTTRLWDLAGDPTASGSNSAGSTAGGLAIDSRGSSVVAARPDELTRRDIPSGRVTASWLAPGESTSSIALGADDTLLAAAGDDGAVVYDTRTGAVVAAPLNDTPAASVAFDPIGERLLVGGPGLGLVELGDDRRTAVVPGQFWTYDGVFSPDGSTIAVSHTVSPTFTEVTAPFDGVVELVDARSLDVVAAIDFGVVSGSAVQRDAVTDLAFDPDGSLLATASKDGSTAIWDGATLAERGRLLGQGGEISSVAFDPSSGEVATASTNGTIRIWNVDTGTTRLTLASDRAVTDIAYSPDGRYLAATDPDGAVTAHPLDLDELVATAREEMTRGLTDAECDRYLRMAGCPTA